MLIWICFEIMANQVKIVLSSTLMAVNWLERLLAMHKNRCLNHA
jgi:hypothetical protein